MTDLALLCNGQRYTNWLAFEADAQLETPAAAYSCTVRADQEQLLAFSLGAWIQVLVDQVPVLLGRIDQIVSTRDRSRSLVTIRGRDQGGLLLDQSVQLSWTFNETTLEALMAVVATHAGLTGPVVSEDSGSFDAKAEPGESCWQFLERVAARRGLQLWIDPEGWLHAGQWATELTPVGILLRRTGTAAQGNNLIAGEVTRSILGRVSKITVVGATNLTQPGAPLPPLIMQLAGAAVDATFPFNRELVIQDHEIQTQAEAAARASKEMRTRLARSFVARYRVRGFQDATGNPWAPNTAVTVVDEREGLAEDLLITGRRFIKSRRDGTVTELILQKPEYFRAA